MAKNKNDAKGKIEYIQQLQGSRLLIEQEGSEVVVGADDNKPVKVVQIAIDKVDDDGYVFFQVQSGKDAPYHDIRHESGMPEIIKVLD